VGSFDPRYAASRIDKVMPVQVKIYMGDHAGRNNKMYAQQVICKTSHARSTWRWRHWTTSRVDDDVRRSGTGNRDRRCRGRGL